MAATMYFNPDHLVNQFNLAVCKRMSEEHTFFKALDEIFQAQRAQIARQADEIRLLRAMFRATGCDNDDETSELGDTPPIDASANGYPSSPTESNERPDSSQTATNESNSGDESAAGATDITVKVEIGEYAMQEQSLPTHNSQLDHGSSIGTGDDFDDTSNSSGDTAKQKKKKKRQLKTSTARQFLCPFCNQHFSMWSAQKRRVVLDNGDKVYTCRACKEEHNLMKSSHAYKKSATHERPFKCHLCSKQFTQSNSLSCHLRAHTGERPFQCRVCSRRFARSDYLKAHMKIHNDEKQHVCAICRKEFREHRHLRYHLRMSHHMVDEVASAMRPPIDGPVPSAEDPLQLLLPKAEIKEPMTSLLDDDAMVAVRDATTQSSNGPMNSQNAIA